MPAKDSGSWKKIRPKVLARRLARDERRNFQMDLIRLEPNTKYPEHTHADIEWVYVLKGGFQDEFGKMKRGDFRVNPKDSTHSVRSGKTGCTLLVCWCGKIA